MNFASVLAPPYSSIITLVVGAAVLLLFTGPLSSQPRVAGVIGALFALGAALLGLSAGPVALAIVALCAVAAVALLVVPTLELAERSQVVESSALLLLGAGGAVALAQATDLVQTIVGLETLALSAVILVGLGQGRRPLEASFKYFVLGAISLAMLLYGVGLVYLATGSFAFPTADLLATNQLVLAGAVLIALGLVFEMALFPLHWGALDAYTAAAPGLAGFVMTSSKLGAAFALGRLVLAAGAPVAQVVLWVGCATIIWGTFGALGQANFRRMLAYSAITHAGFIAVALASGPAGPATAAFYAAAYGSMAMLVFAALAGQGTGTLPYEDARLGEGGALRSTALALGLFSLGGVPPTPGFWAKLAVLVVAWQYAGWLPTVIVAAGGVFSLLYYLAPIPDLFSAIRSRVPGMIQHRGAVPGILLAGVLVIALSILPGLAWSLATNLVVGS